MTADEHDGEECSLDHSSTIWMRATWRESPFSVLFLIAAALISEAQGRRYNNAMSSPRPRHLQSNRELPQLPPKPNGDDACPCLISDNLGAAEPFDTLNFDETLGPEINISIYGLGCAPHDVNATSCSTNGTDCLSVVPLPKVCERGWCRRSFCYVNPERCDLINRPSNYFKGRHFSYATCGFMDFFTNKERIASLRGDTLKVAYNSNSGGWKGAYNPEGSFAINDLWRGPVVDFMNNVALRGSFTINITSPPEWLWPGSRQFFGQSKFDLCVYAASLGYVDLCVAAYSITDKRASVTSFFETTDNSIYLVTYSEGGTTTIESFWAAFKGIFAPFTTGSWCMILLFSLPVLGVLMIHHEYGAPGSAYPRTVPVLSTDSATGEELIVNKKVPKIWHVGRSLYMAFLAFFQESYDQSVVTLGGKIHLLAISSLVYLVLAVYTANLAAILTSNLQRAPVDTVEGAVRAGYNFCAERKVAEIILARYAIDPEKIVPDPEKLGGDGEPGFNCPQCNSRTRVFDFMRQHHSDTSLYCNAAFVELEDLEALHMRGYHCDKAKVGDALAHISVGIPLYDGISDSLVALLYDVKNDGHLSKEIAFYEPSSSCPERGGEGSALTVEQLTGIWMIAFSFAAAALLAKFIESLQKRRKVGRERNLEVLDQWGNPSSHKVIIDGKCFDARSRHFTLERDKESIRMSVAHGDLFHSKANDLNLVTDQDEDDGDKFHDNGISSKQ